MYAIAKDKTVEIFNDNSTEPIIYQPYFPNGEVFESDEEALAWANEYIESVVNPDALFARHGRNEERKVKPTKEELQKLRIESLGLSPEDIAYIVAQASN